MLFYAAGLTHVRLFKSPFMVANGQIAGFEEEWKNLNREVRPFLRYNVIDVAGTHSSHGLVARLEEGGDASVALLFDPFAPR